MDDDNDYEDLGGITRSVASTETFPLLSQKLHSKTLGNIARVLCVCVKGGVPNFNDLKRCV